jgi:hypothetical protein
MSAVVELIDPLELTRILPDEELLTLPVNDNGWLIVRVSEVIEYPGKHPHGVELLSDHKLVVLFQFPLLSV